MFRNRRERKAAIEPVMIRAKNVEIIRITDTLVELQFRSRDNVEVSVIIHQGLAWTMNRKLKQIVGLEPTREGRRSIETWGMRP